ncbi:hypothetical protein DUI87_13191 [Hirundo rustica rustica]|uniref:Uncharacterized protein n=1 Tax=Hirundo rustica rustica TaxID=333673 RepID=A0A3M0KTB9_HIRRU|nr:hypothetical protein DUI87_13191 [Hirundo rustica rustica]
MSFLGIPELDATQEGSKQSRGAESPSSPAAHAALDADWDTIGFAHCWVMSSLSSSSTPIAIEDRGTEVEYLNFLLIHYQFTSTVYWGGMVITLFLSTPSNDITRKLINVLQSFKDSVI